VKRLRRKDSVIAYGRNDQFQLPWLHAGLAKELKSDSSPLSKAIEHHHFSVTKISSNKFSSFHKHYKPSLGSRLRLLYYHVVVKNNWKFLAAVFRIKEIPFPETTKSKPSFGKIGSKETFFLKYQPKSDDFDTIKYNLSLKNWAYASTFRYAQSIPEELLDQFMEAYQASQHRTDGKQTVQTQQEKHGTERASLGDAGVKELVDWYLKKQARTKKDWKKEWDDFFYPHFVDGNYNPESNLIKQQRSPTVAATIERNNACWEPFRQFHADCAAHFRIKFLKNQYTWDKNDFYLSRKDPDSLFGSLGIDNYAKYVCTVLNNAWIFFSEECADLHYTRVINRGPLKGLGGHGNGYHRLGAARIIARWNDDEKLAELRNDFPNLLCIQPFKSTKDAEDFCARWESNFIVPEDETIYNPVDEKSLKDDPGFDSPLGKQLEYKSIKESWEFIHRDKNPERANALWTKVVKKNHRLQHKYFSKADCEMAKSYILRWLHRPRA
jgi:hypothetical protein